MTASILSSNTNSAVILEAFELHLDQISNWSSNYKIKINAKKSVHVSFTLKKINALTLNLRGNFIFSSSQVKYLGITLNKRLI